MLEYVKDTHASRVLKGNTTTPDKDKSYQVRQGIHFYKGKIYLVPSSKLKRKIIATFHDSPLAKHT